MTDEEKISAICSLADIPKPVSQDLLKLYLDIAGRKIIAKAYPYKTSVTAVPQKYESIQLEIAAYLLNKRGAEGETAHNENGINRSYENADVPASMLKGVIPVCGVLV